MEERLDYWKDHPLDFEVTESEDSNCVEESDVSQELKFGG